MKRAEQLQNLVEPLLVQVGSIPLDLSMMYHIFFVHFFIDEKWILLLSSSGVEPPPPFLMVFPNKVGTENERKRNYIIQYHSDLYTEQLISLCSLAA